jgi:large repetitive protein
MVTLVAPITGPTTGGTVVTINGAGFVIGAGNTTVSFGGTASASLSVASTTQLTTLAPAHTAGAFDVRVTTAGGTSAAVPANDTFTYVAAAPVITAFSPTAGTPGGGTTVTITGTGFTGATGATFGGVSATGFIVDSDTQVRVSSPAHLAGVVDVVVTGPGGASLTGAATKYTYTAAVIPVVTALSPASATIAGGPVVSISGAGFTGATGVTFGGTPATGVTVLSDTTILATAPAHAAGIVDVLVTTPAGTSVGTAGSKFTYGTLPVVTAISPATGGSGTVITITGTGFAGATSVMFGTVSVIPTSVTDTQIVVTAPTGVSGAVDIRVVTPAGTSAIVAADNFTFPGSTTSYTLSVRWSLIVWQGKDGISATAALKGLESPDNPATNDVSSRVTAMYRWNPAQKWDGFFPGSESIPGANDFTTLTKGVAYFTAINGSSAATWTIEQG